ncbi:MAG: hypothetical protein AAFN81_02190 [Bacteroidota bacterium]
MKAILCKLLFLLFTGTLFAQSYDIGQYRARFESRPFLEVTPRISYASIFTNADVDQDNHQGRLSASAVWREQSNLDHRILSWSLGGNGGFSLQEYDNPDLPDLSSNDFSLQGSVEQYNYGDSKTFWGFRGNASIDIQNRNEGEDPADRRRAISINPGLFIGTGRIEFSEDALLANWMMDDLLEAGVITSASPEQRLALAQRVTSIIGNRTFDFRRRRIYELKQLHTLFQEEEMAIADDFLLFAVLNDNWGFANRAVLPHGQRWQFGLDLGGNYSFRSLPFAIDGFIALASPYINFQHANIHHNNAATIWEVELVGSYTDFLDEGSNGVPSFSAIPEWRGAFNLQHSYVWLPISRTTLRWTNSINVDFEDFKRRDFSFQQKIWDINLESVLQWDYFITYNWRLTLNAGIISRLIYTDVSNVRNLRPYFNVQTNYAIF